MSIILHIVNCGFAQLVHVFFFNSHPRSMFIILSFVKIFHWLVQDRVDFIETTPNVTRLQHIRIVAFTLVLLVRLSAFLCSCAAWIACACCTSALWRSHCGC